MASTTTTTTTTNTKKRSSFASCLACRAQHCACDEVRPCNRCARLGIPCTEGVSRKAKAKQPQYQLDTPSISNTLMNAPYNELEKELFLEKPELHFQPTYTNPHRSIPSQASPFISSLPPNQPSQTILLSQQPSSMKGMPTVVSSLNPSPHSSQGPYFHPIMMQTFLSPHGGPTLSSSIDISASQPSFSPIPSHVPLTPSSASISPSLSNTMLPPDISSLSNNPLAISNGLISSSYTHSPSRHHPDSPSSYLSSPSSESENEYSPSHSPTNTQYVDINTVSNHGASRNSPPLSQHHQHIVQQHSPPQQPQQPHQQSQQNSPLTPQSPSTVVTTVSKLAQEVDDLKHELWLARQKSTNTFPFLNQVQPRSLAMSLWKLPEGELVDFSAGFHAMLALNVYDRITFDLISPKELKVERANLWSFFAREKPCLSGIVTKKPLVNGRGDRIIPLSMCALIHFGETTLLQCTFWLN